MPPAFGRATLRVLLSEALRSIAVRKVRYSFAALGVGIATATIVLAGNMLESVSANVLEHLDRLGARTVFVAPRSPLEVGVETFRRHLSIADLVPLRNTLDVAERVAPDFAFSTEIRACGKLRLATIVGVTSSALTGGNWELGEVTPGFLSERFDGNESVAIVGAGVSKDLQCLEAPSTHLLVGRTLLLVLGELLPRGNIAGKTLDSVILVPISTAERSLSDFVPRSISIQISLKSGIDPEVGRLEVVSALRSLHRIQTGEPDDFRVTLQTDLMRRARDARASTRKVLFALVSWALLLGAVGVSNALSASIVERTSEIGLRRAVGAPMLAIATQFVCEGLLVSILGCVGGAVVGAVFALGLANWLDVQPRVDVSLASAVILTNIALGIAGSLVPALNGANRPPVHAMEND